MAIRKKHDGKLSRAQSVEQVGKLIGDLIPEVMSFKGTTIEDWLKHWHPDFPRWLSTSRGLLRLNQRAADLIHEVSRLVAADDVEMRNLIESDVLSNAVASALAEALVWASELTERQPDLDLSDVASKFFDTLRESLKNNYVDVTWLVPCHIFDPDQDAPAFSVGPVTFTPRTDWLTQTTYDIHKDWILDYWKGDLSRDDLLKRVSVGDSRASSTHDCAIRFASCPWVAEVHISGHAASRSRRKADALVDLALSFVGLAFGPENSSAIAAEGSNRQLTIRRSLGFDLNGHCLSGISHHKLGVGSEKGGATSFVTKSKSVFSDGGHLLQEYLERSANETVPPLVERWVSALYWFGLAVHEPLDFMSVVHYVNAVDILSGAGGNLGRMTAFVEAALGRDADSGLLNDGTTSKDVLNKLYNEVRSGLVHGSKHGLLADMVQDRMLAHELTRKLLFMCTAPLARVVRDADAMLQQDKGRDSRAFEQRLRSTYHDQR